LQSRCSFTFADISESVYCTAHVYLRMLTASFYAFQGPPLNIHSAATGPIYKETEMTRTELMNFFWSDGW
jgi:hypothetical protein